MDYSPIRTMRKEAGLTQVELSEAGNVSQTLLSLIEKGERRVTTENAMKLAGALGRDWREVFLRHLLFTIRGRLDKRRKLIEAIGPDFDLGSHTEEFSNRSIDALFNEALKLSGVMRMAPDNLPVLQECRELIGEIKSLMEKVRRGVEDVDGVTVGKVEALSDLEA